MAIEARCADFERGIELFNAGRFFEAHEAWERVWLRSSGEEKLFYQGLIQAAAALLHAERGNPRGAQSMYAKARARLDPFPDRYMGIALGELRAGLREFFALPAKPVPPARPLIGRRKPRSGSESAKRHRRPTR